MLPLRLITIDTGSYEYAPINRQIDPSSLAQRSKLVEEILLCRDWNRSLDASAQAQDNDRPIYRARDEFKPKPH